ncbi:class I lanthipeptide [Aquimarina brevivitae]|uniref:Uncharacterized protein n=1 Tax=Aquimarina brevivitae TaxID=323412 RepID=A0A4Q7PFB6_9FLAO|nr:class I lanthipeptide [Aquimarina brevivitae]RZS99156.1 hypothetical protein EV197_0364 [Aquimarina brevivitae]
MKNKKLSLKKQTISKLTNSQKKQINGGGESTILCVTTLDPNLSVVGTMSDFDTAPTV